MAQTSKYNFGQSFDPGASEEELRATPKYTDDDLSAARQQGHDEGHAAGLAAALASEEHRLVELLTAVADQAAGLVAEFDQHVAAHADRTQELGLLVCRKILPTMAERYGLTEIEGLIGECLNNLQDEPRVVVRVDNMTLPMLQERIERISTAAGSFDGNVVLLADDELASTDCKVLWADGGADRDIDKLMTEIDAVIDRHLTSSNPSATREPSDAVPSAADPAAPASSLGATNG